MRKKNQNQAEKLEQVLKDLEVGVEEFFTSERFIDYLNVMSKFHTYSLNNQILIARQKPEATHVAGYNSWIGNFKRHVKQGEVGIRILAPQKRIKEIDTGKTDGYGNAITEKREYITFRPVSVFDVSQTDGRELPSLIDELTGQVQDFDLMLNAIQSTAPFPFSIEDTGSAAKGYCSYAEKKIVIKPGMSEMQTIKTAVHETAHGRVHGDDKTKTREQKEVEAESIAYVVCQHFGIDTSDYSFGYVAAWARGKDKEILKQSMNTIRDEAKLIIEGIEKELEAPGITEVNKTIKAVTKDVIESSDLEQINFKDIHVLNNSTHEDNVTILACYDGFHQEGNAKDILNDDIKQRLGSNVSIQPFCMTKDKDMEMDMQRTDDKLPMVTVLANNCDVKLLPGHYLNIYDFDQVLQENEMQFKDQDKKGKLTIKIEYTYMGCSKCIVDQVAVGYGRTDFIDHLDLVPEERLYLQRHHQVQRVVSLCRNEMAVGMRGTYRQNAYEDMIFEWAEKSRLELNYSRQPKVSKPPEYNEKLVEQWRGWEMKR